jgi:cholesterol oxidase
MNVTLTLSTGPIDEFLKRTDHRARIIGTVSCRALSDEPMMIESGVFTVYTGTEDEPADECAILYKMILLCVTGERYRFDGRKPIAAGHIIESWIKPAKILVTISKIENGTETVFGRGKLGEHDDDFFSQVSSFRVSFLLSCSCFFTCSFLILILATHTDILLHLFIIPIGR